MSYKFFLTGFLFIIILLFPSIMFSQGESTVLFLLISPSPTLNGMGRVGAALPNNEPLGFYYNPAQLGNIGQNKNFAFQFYPSKTNLNIFSGLDDYTFNHLAATYGHKFKNGVKSSPIRLGFGYMRGGIDYGEQSIINEYGEIIDTYNSKEYYNAFGIGVGFDLFINVNFGLTYKNISSRLGPGIFVGELNREANEHAIDYGILMTIPALRFFSNEFQAKDQSILPYFDVSFGYAKTNIGGKVEYASKTQADPLPRTAVIGYSISTGIKSFVKEYPVRMISFDWACEANDILVIRKAHNDIEYQALTGDINLWDNVILAKGDEKTENRYGFQFQFFEFIGFSSGQFNGRGKDVDTKGFSINLKGLFFALMLAGAKDLDFAANHFDLQYSWSQYNTDGYGFFSNSTYHSITLSIHDL